MKSKVLTALLSVLLAFTLWSYVITVEQPESEETFYNVPVVLDGGTILSERSLMITSETNLTVTLKLSGNRSDLNKLRSSDITVLADLTKIYEAGEKSLAYDISFPGDVQNSAIEVVSREPDNITLTVVEWASKEIPVEVEFLGSVPEDYVADKQDMVLDADSVAITGPKEVVDRIAKAVVCPDLTGRTETFTESYRYTLCDAADQPVEDVSAITTNQGEIGITLGIQKVQDVALTYQVIDGGGLTAEDVTISMEYQSITVAGSTADLAGLTEVFLGVIDLGTMTENGVLTFNVALPEGVSNLSGINEITVAVTLPEVETRSYTVTNFQQRNVPAGKTAQILAQRLEVKVRGMGPILDSLEAENIIALVDFTGAENGRAKFDVEIQITGVENVGAVGVYTVYAEVSDTVSAGTGVQDAEPPEAVA